MPNKIKLTKYYIEINAQPGDPDLLKLCKHIQPVVRMRTANTYRCSLSFIPEVLRIMRGIKSVDMCADDAVRRLYEEELTRRARTADLKRCGPDVMYDGLWEHQSLGVCLADVNRRYNFFYDTRTGKTRMAYQIMLNALKAGRAKRCLVLAPSAIIPDWLADAKHFPELKIAAYYKDDKTKRTALAQPTHVLIWSEGMFASALKFIETIGFDICFFDESSKLKSHKSQVSKAAIDLSLMIPSWYNLSATPAPNGEWEYFVQMQTVDPYLFSSYTTHFYNKYFDDLATSSVKYHKWKMKEDMRPEFMERVNSRSIYVDQSVMPTAEKHWHVVQFQLQDRAWAAYETMAKSMALEVGDHEITADQSVAMRAKLNQIASGFVLDTDAIADNKLYRKLGLPAGEQEVYYVGNGERLSMLRRLLQSIEDKDPGASVIIWANYTAEFTMLKEMFGRTAVYINGRTSTRDREHYIELFRQKGVKYLVAHPLSIGMGINLTVSHHAIYYSLNDSWEALKQSSERIMGHIDVQPHDVNYYMLLAFNTVNGIIYNNLMNKRDASLGLLEHLKAVAKNA